MWPLVSAPIGYVFSIFESRPLQPSAKLAIKVLPTTGMGSRSLFDSLAALASGSLSDFNPACHAAAVEAR